MSRFTKKEIKERYRTALIHHNASLLSFTEVRRIKRLIEAAEHAVRVFTSILKNNYK